METYEGTIPEKTAHYICKFYNNLGKDDIVLTPETIKDIMDLGGTCVLGPSITNIEQLSISFVFQSDCTGNQQITTPNSRTIKLRTPVSIKSRKENYDFSGEIKKSSKYRYVVFEHSETGAINYNDTYCSKEDKKGPGVDIYSVGPADKTSKKYTWVCSSLQNRRYDLYKYNDKIGSVTLFFNGRRESNKLTLTANILTSTPKISKYYKYLVSHLEVQKIYIPIGDNIKGTKDVRSKHLSFVRRINVNIGSIEWLII